MLQADLSKVDRGRTPWLLVLFHVPWYNSNKAHQCEGDEMKAAMEGLLHAAGVDVMFAGHVHAYERSVRITRLLTITLGVLIHCHLPFAICNRGVCIMEDQILAALST